MSLTWKDVIAPNFTGANAAIKESAFLLNRAFEGLGDGVGKFREAQLDRGESNLLAALQQYQDGRSAQEALASGAAEAGIDPTHLSAQARRNALGMVRDIGSTALSNIQYDSTKDEYEQMLAEREYLDRHAQTYGMGENYLDFKARQQYEKARMDQQLHNAKIAQLNGMLARRSGGGGGSGGETPSYLKGLGEEEIQQVDQLIQNFGYNPDPEVLGAYANEMGISNEILKGYTGFVSDRNKSLNSIGGDYSGGRSSSNKSKDPSSPGSNIDNVINQHSQLLSRNQQALEVDNAIESIEETGVSPAEEKLSQELRNRSSKGLEITAKQGINPVGTVMDTLNELTDRDIESPSVLLSRANEEDQIKASNVLNQGISSVPERKGIVDRIKNINEDLSKGYVNQQSSKRIEDTARREVGKFEYHPNESLKRSNFNSSYDYNQAVKEDKKAQKEAYDQILERRTQELYNQEFEPALGNVRDNPLLEEFKRNKNISRETKYSTPDHLNINNAYNIPLKDSKDTTSKEKLDNILEKVSTESSIRLEKESLSEAGLGNAPTKKEAEILAKQIKNTNNLDGDNLIALASFMPTGIRMDQHNSGGSLDVNAIKDAYKEGNAKTLSKHMLDLAEPYTKGSVDSKKTTKNIQNGIKDLRDTKEGSNLPNALVSYAIENSIEPDGKGNFKVNLKKARKLAEMVSDKDFVANLSVVQTFASKQANDFNKIKEALIEAQIMVNSNIPNSPAYNYYLNKLNDLKEIMANHPLSQFDY